MLIETNYSGDQSATLYQLSQGEVTHLCSFGRCLYIVESNQRLVVYNTESISAQTVLVDDGIERVLPFDLDKLIWYDGDGNPNYLNTTYGTTILLSEEETENLISPYFLPTSSAQNSTYAINDPNMDKASHNDISFPLAEYPALLQNNFSKLVNVQSYFNRSYAGGATQCNGFAKYAHDKFWHLHDDNRNRPSWVTSSGTVTGDYHGASLANMDNSTHNPANDANTIKLNTEEALRNFFANLDRGSVVRYVSATDDTPYDGRHSIVFDTLAENGQGIYVYECNQDTIDNKRNAVGYQYYDFDVLNGHYTIVLYYVEHTLGAKSAQSTTRHKTACTNCAGYLLQTHTASATYTSHDDTKHRVSFSCCSGYVLKNHVILSGTIDRCKICNWIEPL